MTVDYYLSSALQRIEPDSYLWKEPFPISISHQPLDPGNIETVILTYGEYFTAVRQFLETAGRNGIAKAASEIFKISCSLCDIENINIFLVKHGEFYHPCRIDARITGKWFLFVVNVAVSSPGKRCIWSEYNLLQRLSAAETCAFLPRVYEYGEIDIRNGCEIKMFLGEWFEGFHEFHISVYTEDQRHRLRVWDPEQPNGFLNHAQTLEVYSQVAQILTGCYDPEQLLQIYPWHHAAGDFIVNCTNSSLRLKLITVRQYNTLLESDDKDESALLEAMLFFLVNLSIRTRLDRLDGTGQIVWADAAAVEGTVHGFWKALAHKISWPEKFRNHIWAIAVPDILEISDIIVNSYHPMAPELPVIRCQLLSHARELFEVLHSEMNEGDN